MLQHTDRTPLWAKFIEWNERAKAMHSRFLASLFFLSSPSHSHTFLHMIPRQLPIRKGGGAATNGKSGYGHIKPIIRTKKKPAAAAVSAIRSGHGYGSRT